MENMVSYPSPEFWNNKKVFITGHTSFKGSWLIQILQKLNCKIFGYSNSLPSSKCLFQILNLQNFLPFSSKDDIRDFERLSKKFSKIKPEIAIHLAAQPLVRHSYIDPIGTFHDNVLGTANFILAALRNDVQKILVITTDKVYENLEMGLPFKEEDRLGGLDPYSASKACAEIIAKSMHYSFSEGQKVFTARAGNVIGGGDYAEDRLIPDIYRSIYKNQQLVIRNPQAIRPWQHVMDPLFGYLKLVEEMDNIQSNSGAFNFGPSENSFLTVEEIIVKVKFLNKNLKFSVNPSIEKESNILKLDSSKAKRILGWESFINLEEAIFLTNEFYTSDDSVAQNVIERQINNYLV